MTATPYHTLLDRFKTISALSQAAGILSWDQETMMPPKGAAQRAEQLGAMAAIIHEKVSDPEIGTLLDNIDTDSLDQTARTNVTEARRSHSQAIKIPTSLAAELARETAKSQGIWAKARTDNRFEDFAPMLGRILELKRQEAKCLQEAEQNLYDVLLDQFEPGTDSQSLTSIFDELKTPLIALRQRIADSSVNIAPLSGHFPQSAQLDLSKELVKTFHYDQSAGRLDLSTHPFSSGNFGDARITTRIDESEPLGCAYSTIHEIGHAVYEQNIDSALMFQPAGSYASMGVHESQSRFFENQIGRSRAFMTQLAPMMQEMFGDNHFTDADDLYQKINRVETGFIRTEADEVHYNLHIILRFELEQALIGGELEVDGLEAEWNQRFEALFGLTVPDAAHGVLQDVHWSVGLFGYFPTYALGNIYAGCLFKKMTEYIDDMPSLIEAGDLEAPVSWLQENVHKHGRTRGAKHLIETACGFDVSADPLLTYLEQKFSALYKL